MDQPSAPSAVPLPLSRVAVLDTEIAYVDRGTGDPIVFLHGNPTSSYLWRNVIPRLEGLGRCLAPDLVGMGESGKATDGSYRFADHARHLDQWFASLGLNQNVTLVVHDWGSALGFHWAHRHQSQLKGLVYIEAIVRPLTWEEWPDSATPIFQGMRSPEGERMVLERNLFVERILPGSIIRELSQEEAPKRSRRDSGYGLGQAKAESQGKGQAQTTDGGNRRLMLSAPPRQALRKTSPSVVTAEPQAGDEQVCGEEKPLFARCQHLPASPLGGLFCIYAVGQRVAYSFFVEH